MNMLVLQFNIKVKMDTILVNVVLMLLLGHRSAVWSQSTHDACSNGTSEAEEFEVIGSSWPDTSGLCSCIITIPNITGEVMFRTNATMHDDGCGYLVQKTRNNRMEPECSTCVDLSMNNFTKGNNYTLFIERPSGYSEGKMNNKWYRISASSQVRKVKLKIQCWLKENKKTTPPCTPLLTDVQMSKNTTTVPHKKHHSCTDEEMSPTAICILGWTVSGILVIAIGSFIIYNRVQTGRCICIKQTSQYDTADAQPDSYINNESQGTNGQTLTQTADNCYQDLQSQAANEDRTYDALVEVHDIIDDTYAQPIRNHAVSTNEKELEVSNSEPDEYQDCAIGKAHASDKLPLYNDNMVYSKY